MKRISFSRFFILLLAMIFFLSHTISPLATSESELDTDFITSPNSVENWPQAPSINSESAVLIDAETGTVLYDKNMHQKNYPASITKILTALLAIENCSLNEMVSFSDNAVFSIPRDSSHIAITPGEELSVENCLYGLLLASANEVANALAEHISGNIPDFVTLMNKRAKELGAINTHFNNANGLPDEEHYTTSYDMAMISRAAALNETFTKINSTVAYIIPPTNLQPESRPVNSFHPLLISGTHHYDGCFGGKTGYTTIAGNTLVTFAKRNGITLICVVMKSDADSVYLDSTALLDYGFANFQKINIAENETHFNFQQDGFFASEHSIFKTYSPKLTINTNGIILLPIGEEFSSVKASVKFLDNTDINHGSEAYPFAVINYTYNGHFVGSTTLDIEPPHANTFAFTNSSTEAINVNESLSSNPSSVHKSYIIINIWYILFILLAVFIAGFLIYLYLFLRRQRSRYRYSHINRQEFKSFQKRRRKRKNYPTRKLY